VKNEKLKSLKRKSNFFILILSLLSLSQFVNAQPQFSPRGLNGHVGAGFADFIIREPSQNFQLDQGIYATLGGEKGMNIWNFYITFGFNYLKTKGTTNYDYSTLSGVQYTTSDANFDANVFQAGLGLKLKLIEGFFSPFVEGGGTFGYYLVKYNFTTTQIQNDLDTVGADYKSEDTLLEFGTYLEGGVEIAFSEEFALRAAFRLIQNLTKEFYTLANSKIDYTAEIFYLSLLKQF